MNNQQTVGQTTKNRFDAEVRRMNEIIKDWGFGGALAIVRDVIDNRLEDYKKENKYPEMIDLYQKRRDIVQTAISAIDNI